MKHIILFFCGIFSEFAAKCPNCALCIEDDNWVMKAKDTDLYHLDCFSCDSCKTRLGRGDQCTLHEDRILCRETQFLEPNEGGFSNGKT